MIQKQTVTVFSLGMVALLVAIGACSFLFWQIKQKNEAISLLFAENSIAASKDQQYKVLQKVLEDTEAERELINSHIIPPDGVVPFIEFVEQLGSLSNVSLKLDSIAPGLWNGKKHPTIEALEVNITAIGSWQNIYRFLAEVEHMPYLIKLEQVQLEKVAEESKSYWRANLKFRAVKEK